MIRYTLSLQGHLLFSHHRHHQLQVHLRTRLVFTLELFSQAISICGRRGIHCRVGSHRGPAVTAFAAASAPRRPLAAVAESLADTFALVALLGGRQRCHGSLVNDAGETRAHDV